MIAEIEAEININECLNTLNEKHELIKRYFSWATIPDCLWIYLLDEIRTQYKLGVHTHNPIKVFESFMRNYSYGNFDLYKRKEDSDDEFLNEIKGKTFFKDEKERIVCFFKDDWIDISNNRLKNYIERNDK